MAKFVGRHCVTLQTTVASPQRIRVNYSHWAVITQLFPLLGFATAGNNWHYSLCGLHTTTTNIKTLYVVVVKSAGCDWGLHRFIELTIIAPLSFLNRLVQSPPLGYYRETL